MRIQHAVETALLSATSFLVRAVPRRAALGLGAGMGQLAWSLRIRRRVVLENLAQALPHAGEKLRRSTGARAARNLGRTFVEFLRFSGKDRRNLERLVAVEGLGALQRALDDGKGAIVVTGHLGAWALYVTALAASGIRSALLVGRQSNPGVDRLILRMPGDLVEFISKGRRAPRGVLRGLKANRAIVMVADHYSSPETLWVPFLGRPASTLTLPGALIRRHRLPLFLMAGHREDAGAHRVVVRRIELPSGDGEEDLEYAIAARLNEALGQEILRHPDQYYWYHKRWKDRHPWRRRERHAEGDSLSGAT